MTTEEYEYLTPLVPPPLKTQSFYWEDGSRTIEVATPGGRFRVVGPPIMPEPELRKVIAELSVLCEEEASEYRAGD